MLPRPGLVESDSGFVLARRIDTQERDLELGRTGLELEPALVREVTLGKDGTSPAEKKPEHDRQAAPVTGVHEPPERVGPASTRPRA